MTHLFAAGDSDCEEDEDEDEDNEEEEEEDEDEVDSEEESEEDDCKRRGRVLKGDEGSLQTPMKECVSEGEEEYDDNEEEEEEEEEFESAEPKSNTADGTIPTESVCDADRFCCSWHEMPSIIPDDAWRPIDLCRQQSALVSRLNRLSEQINNNSTGPGGSAAHKKAVAVATAAAVAAATPTPTTTTTIAPQQTPKKRRVGKLAAETSAEISSISAALKEINDKLHGCVMEYTRAAMIRAQTPEQLGYGTLMSCSQQFKERLANACVHSHTQPANCAGQDGSSSSTTTTTKQGAASRKKGGRATKKQTRGGGRGGRGGTRGGRRGGGGCRGRGRADAGGNGELPTFNEIIGADFPQ